MLRRRLVSRRHTCCEGWDGRGIAGVGFVWREMLGSVFGSLCLWVGSLCLWVGFLCLGFVVLGHVVDD